MSSNLTTCKNCGRRFPVGTGVGLTQAFCCKGCQLDFQKKKYGNISSEDNSSGNKKPTLGSYILLGIIVIIIIIVKGNH